MFFIPESLKSINVKLHGKAIRFFFVLLIITFSSCICLFVYFSQKNIQTHGSEIFSQDASGMLIDSVLPFVDLTRHCRFIVNEYQMSFSPSSYNNHSLPSSAISRCSPVLPPLLPSCRWLRWLLDSRMCRKYLQGFEEIQVPRHFP